MRLELLGASRKLSFASSSATRNPSPPCERESKLVALKGSGSQLVLGPIGLSTNVIESTNNVTVEGCVASPILSDPVLNPDDVELSSKLTQPKRGKEVLHGNKMVSSEGASNPFAAGAGCPKSKKLHKLKRDTIIVGFIMMDNDVTIGKISRKMVWFDEDVNMEDANNSVCEKRAWVDVPKVPGDGLIK